MGIFSLTKKPPAYIESSEFGTNNLARPGRVKSNDDPFLSVYGWGGFPYLDTVGGPEASTFALNSSLTTTTPQGLGGNSPIPSSAGQGSELFNPDYSGNLGIGG